jgi:hypothetical protein
LKVAPASRVLPTVSVKIPADGGPSIVIWTEIERIPYAIAVDVPGNVYIYTQHQTTILPIAVVKIPADGGPDTVINVAGNDAGYAPVPACARSDLANRRELV